MRSYGLATSIKSALSLAVARSIVLADVKALIGENSLVCRKLLSSRLLKIRQRLFSFTCFHMPGSAQSSLTLNFVIDVVDT